MCVFFWHNLQLPALLSYIHKKNGLSSDWKQVSAPGGRPWTQEWSPKSSNCGLANAVALASLTSLQGAQKFCWTCVWIVKTSAKKAETNIQLWWGVGILLQRRFVLISDSLPSQSDITAFFILSQSDFAMTWLHALLDQTSIPLRCRLGVTPILLRFHVQAGCEEAGTRLQF